MEPEPKRKRVMSEDALRKLGLAREKALAVRREQHAARLQAKAAALSEVKEEDQSSAPSPPPSPQEPAPPKPSPPSPSPPSPEAPVRKKKKPVFIVEQSSSDEDSFESQSNVIFVKRHRPKQQKHASPIPARAPPTHEFTAYSAGAPWMRRF